MSKNTWVVSVGTRIITSMVTCRLTSPSVIHDHRIFHRTASDTQHTQNLSCWLQKEQQRMQSKAQLISH